MIMTYCLQRCRVPQVAWLGPVRWQAAVTDPFGVRMYPRSLIRRMGTIPLNLLCSMPERPCMLHWRWH